MKNTFINNINTNEILGELSGENLISSHVKITSYLHDLLAAQEQKSGARPGHQALLEDRPHGIIIQMHALS